MINIKESDLDKGYEVHLKIPEFKDPEDTLENFKKRIEGKKSLVLVGFVDEKPAGYIISYDRYDDGSIYCWMAGVLPEYRKLGVLSGMMEYLEKWAKEEGFDSIKIKTRNARREMLSYLVKNDFQFLGIEPKEDKLDNRILLEKHYV